MLKRFLLIGFAFVIFLPSTVFGAIAFDVATQGGTVSGVTSMTFSHTSTTSADRILWVGAFGGDTVDVNPTVTYGGVSMTQDGRIITNNNHYSYLYHLVAPATGANDVVLSWSGAHFMAASAITYTGAKQTGQPDATSSASAAGTSITASVTTVADNSWVMMIAAADTGTTPTAGASTTRRTDNKVSYDLYDSNGPVSPPTSFGLTTTFDVSGNNALVASFAPSVASAASAVPQMQTTWWWDDE